MPKSLAIWVSVTRASRFSATRTTSSRNSWGNGLVIVIILPDQRSASQIECHLTVQQAPTNRSSTPNWDYGAVLHETDQHIGRLVTYLKETDQYDNTLIVLASDNGPSASTQDSYARIAPGVPEWYEQNYPPSGSVDSYG